VTPDHHPQTIAVSNVIVTAAVSGSNPTREMNPAVPYTPEEIANEIVACCEAGAAVAHVHVREPETGAPSHRLDLFQEVVERVRSRCDIVLNLTTSGLNLTGDDVDERRLEPVELRPEMASLDIGSVNFSNRVFQNAPVFGMLAAERMRARGVKPEIEVFDFGHIAQARDLIEKGYFEDPPYFQLCMGIRWGIPATPENLLSMRRSLPEGAPWSVLGVGRMQLPMIAMGLLLGGHVRVGFEDNLYIRKGVLARSNAEFVEQAVQLARQLQREVATPDEARVMLNLRRLPSGNAVPRRN
jgi:3-keto-5-aminohexanoate cleavage enzyme